MGACMISSGCADVMGSNRWGPQDVRVLCRERARVCVGHAYVHVQCVCAIVCLLSVTGVCMSICMGLL